MKHIKLLLVTISAFFLCGLSAFAANVTFSFTPASQTSPVEYFIERQNPDGTWSEVVRGPGSPLIGTGIPDGISTFRAKAQWVGAAPGQGISEPSNTVTAVLGAPKPPAELIIAVMTVSITKDGTMRLLAVKDADGKPIVEIPRS